MKCLVFSDSHGYAGFMRRALRNHPDCEAVFFLGDGLRDLDELWGEFPTVTFYPVRGNCDTTFIAMGMSVLKTGECTLMGKRIVYNHGDLTGVKYGITGTVKLAVETDADIVLFGHTHSPVAAYIPIEAAAAEGFEAKTPFYIMNPGAIGMNGSPTYGVITLTEGEPLLSHGRFL